jgi:hypothetical protein
MLSRQTISGPSLLILVGAFFVKFSFAQDTLKKQSPPPVDSVNQQTTAPPQSPKTSESVQDSPKRILGIIPNFQTTNDTPLAQKPLSPKEKYSLAWHQMFDVSAHFGNAFQAGLQHATDGEPHYGQGWGAYGQRFGAAEADQVTSSFFIYGFFPYVLKQDPRYFRKGCGRILTRIAYSASRTVVARADSGHNTFNASQVFGQLAQAGISNLYYPNEDRDINGTIEGWGMNLAYT